MSGTNTSGFSDPARMLVFARVVHAGTFTAAARELAMPKSTVSRKISELEERLGARLLQRTTRKLSLTDVGRIYYDHCARIVAEIEAADLAVTRMQAAPRGLLRLTVPLNFGYLGPMIGEFLQRFPQVQVELVCTDRVVDLVEEGFDLAIRAGRLADSTLIARPLGAIRNLVVASPRYLARRGTPRHPRDLADHDCVVFGAGPNRSRWTLDRDGQTTQVRVTPRLVVNDFDLLRDVVVAAVGVAMIPSDRLADDLRAQRLQRVLTRWTSPEIPIHGLYPSTRHLSPKVEALLDHLRARMAVDPAAGGKVTSARTAAAARSRSPTPS